MTKLTKKDIIWFSEPEEHNYPSALSYLSLLYAEDIAQLFVDQLQAAGMTKFKAKDIFRASHLSLLGISNYHIRMNYRKLKKHIPLSPILLVRDTRYPRVIIADGYHRLCSIYHIDENASIPCKIV